MSDHLPLEIITGILSRVPVDALPHCRCVSKQWRTLIDSPSFTKLQIDHSTATTRNATLFVIDGKRNLFFHDFMDGLRRETLIDFRALTVDVPDKKPILIGTCNGLLCLTSFQAAIGNLVTGKWHFTPSLKIEDLQPPEGSRDTWTGFYEAGSGFGYDSPSDDYKVVRVLHVLGPNEEGIPSEVFHSGIWSTSREVVTIPYRICQKMGAFVSGAIHWAGYVYNDLARTNLIVGFDLGLAECKEIPPPKYAEGGGLQLRAGELSECLCIFDNCKGRFVDVWMMKEYGVVESWMKMFSVPYPRLSYNWGIKPVGFSMTSGELLLEVDHRKLVWYDVKKGTVEEITVRGPEEGYLEAVVCFGSLISPDGKSPPAKVRLHKKKRFGLPRI